MRWSLRTERRFSQVEEQAPLMKEKEETEAQSEAVSWAWHHERFGATEARGVRLQSRRGARSWGSGSIFKSLGCCLGWIWEYRSGNRETSVRWDNSNMSLYLLLQRGFLIRKLIFLLARSFFSQLPASVSLQQGCWVWGRGWWALN